MYITLNIPLSSRRFLIKLILSLSGYSSFIGLTPPQLTTQLLKGQMKKEVSMSLSCPGANTIKTFVLEKSK